MEPDPYAEQQPPAALTISQLNWTPAWLAGVQAKLGDGFTLDPDGALLVGEDVEETQYGQAAAFLWNTKEKLNISVRLTNRLLGELILKYSNRFNVVPAEAIDAMGLVQSSEKGRGYLLKLARVVAVLPPEVLAIEGLTHSHFQTAVGFSSPDNPEDAARWKERVKEILLQAAECPQERTAKWVGDSIRAMQKEFNIAPAATANRAALMGQYATINYILEHWTEDQFAESGQERRKVLDYRDQIEGDLINRGILTIPDPTNFVPPWRAPEETIIDVTAEPVEVMEPEASDDNELPILE